MAYALGIDTGLAHTGLAMVYIGAHHSQDRVLGVAVITTKPSSKKLNVLASDDLARRARELAGGIDMHLGVWGVEPDLICREAQSLPRNASSAAKIGRAFGITDAHQRLRGVPVVEPTPQGIKRVTTGKASATKAEVQAGVLRRLGESEALQAWHETARKGDLEHGFDAMGAVLASYDSGYMQMLRRGAA